MSETDQRLSTLLREKWERCEAEDRPCLIYKHEFAEYYRKAIDLELSKGAPAPSCKNCEWFEPTPPLELPAENRRGFCHANPPAHDGAFPPTRENEYCRFFTWIYSYRFQPPRPGEL